MGCASSRLDDLPAVALCRDRCNFLGDAVHHRSALADAHVAYMRSLQQVGLSLHRFFQSHPHPPSPHHHSPPPQSTTTTTTIPAPPSSPPPAAAPSSDSQSHIPDRKTLENGPASVGYFKCQPPRPLADCCPNPDSASFQYYDYCNGRSAGCYGASASPPPHYGGGPAPKSPPPPPSPARNSAWDFLNFFDAYERYDEALHIYDTNCNPQGSEEQGAAAADLEEKGCCKLEDESDGERKENVVTEKEKPREECDCDGGNGNVSEITEKVKDLLEKASQCGDEVEKILDGDCFFLHPENNAACQATSSAPSSAVSLEPSNSRAAEASKIDSASLGSGIMDSRNLSSSMEKLYMWEKKLHDEVKAEEKLRMILEKKCKQLKCMNEKGAEANKIGSAQNVVITLSTKIRISMQVVDKISIMINKLRDEELWPQITALIHGLSKMWRAMLECQKSLSRAVSEAKELDVIASSPKVTDSHLEALVQLKLEVQNWNICFSKWVLSQKGYVKALNGWLLRCLCDEPEQTPDELVHHSPSRIDAPPVFSISNQWSHALEKLSEKEVIEAMQVLFVGLNQLLEGHGVDLNQKMMLDKDMEKKVKSMEKEEQKLLKMMQARDKKRALVTGIGSCVVSPNIVASANANALHSGLTKIFEAMERFLEQSAQAYEELCSCVDKDRQTSENP